MVTDSEALQEILYRYFSIRRPEVARAVYRAATRICEEVLPMAERHATRALELLLERPQLSPRDAIHLATMEGKGIQRLLSTDREFDGIERIQRVDPAVFPA